MLEKRCVKLVACLCLFLFARFAVPPLPPSVNIMLARSKRNLTCYRRSPKAVLGFRAWQQRYFVLSENSLRYFGTRADYKKGNPSLGTVGRHMCFSVLRRHLPRDHITTRSPSRHHHHHHHYHLPGDITLDIIRNVVILTDEDSGGRCFNIELEGGMRTFELRAATVADADRWVRARRKHDAQTDLVCEMRVSLMAVLYSFPSTPPHRSNPCGPIVKTWPRIGPSKFRSTLSNRRRQQEYDYRVVVFLHQFASLANC